MQYISKRNAELSALAVKIRRRVELARKMRSNHNYAERIGELGNRLHIWNIGEGRYISPADLQNPRVANKPRYTQDPVYQKLAGVRMTELKNTASNTMHYEGLVDCVILGLMKKLEERKMTESEYTALAETPRQELRNNILLQVSHALAEAFDVWGYKPNMWHDKDRRRLKFAKRTAADTLEDSFNVDLSEYVGTY